MYRVWYWALIERDGAGRFMARFHDLPDLIAEGATESEAIANLKAVGMDYIRQITESGYPAPRASTTSQLPSGVATKEFSRALIPIDVARALAKPGRRR